MHVADLQEVGKPIRRSKRGVLKALKHDRRLSDDEIEALLNHFDNKTNTIIPMGRILRFAIPTAMRQEEICKIEWSDVDFKKRIFIIRDRKYPRHKDGNHQKVPLLNLIGFDAWQLLLEQKDIDRRHGSHFPLSP